MSHNSAQIHHSGTAHDGKTANYAVAIPTLCSPLPVDCALLCMMQPAACRSVTSRSLLGIGRWSNSCRLEESDRNATPSSAKVRDEPEKAVFVITLQRQALASPNPSNDDHSLPLPLCRRFLHPLSSAQKRCNYLDIETLNLHSAGRKAQGRLANGRYYVNIG